MAEVTYNLLNQLILQPLMSHLEKKSGEPTTLNNITTLLGLEFAIDGLDGTSMSNGENAFIIYLKVDNKTQKSRKINLLKATYVTSQREQLEQDIWLSGYITGEAILKPNSFKKAGLVFYKSKLKAISNRDVIYISLELIQEGVGLNLSFQKTPNNWLLTSKEKTDKEIKLSPKQLEKNLLKRIERFEAFEDRLGIFFEKMSVKVNEDLTFVIYFEVHSNTGTTLENTLKVICVLYNLEDAILAQTDIYVQSEKFFGFTTKEFWFSGVSATEVSKIRIYPEKW